MRAQKGLALVMVLWVSMLLSLLAGSYAFGVRTETRVMADLRGRAEARALAEAAVGSGLTGALLLASLAGLGRGGRGGAS